MIRLVVFRARNSDHSTLVSNAAPNLVGWENSLVKTLNQTPEHPANEELAAFALGKETPNAETIAEHVANCSRCETLVAQTPRDTFMGILNKAKRGDSLTGPYAPKAEPPTTDELPEDLRRQTKYTFLKKLGRGGMGVVYFAEHNLMKRKVAVKLIPPELIGNPAVRERFMQEVPRLTMASVSTPVARRRASKNQRSSHDRLRQPLEGGVGDLFSGVLGALLSEDSRGY